MKSILNKLKETDTKILIGAGIGFLLVLLLGIILITGTKQQNLDKEESQTQSPSQTEITDDNNQRDDNGTIKDIAENETQEDGTHTQNSESIEEGEADAETQKVGGTTSNTQPNTPMTPVQPPSNSEDTNKNETETPSGSENMPTVTEPYTVNVVSAGGHKMYNVKVHAYKDKAMTKLFTTAATNNKGKATLQLEVGKEYVLALSNVPIGYHVNSNYSLTGKTTTIVLQSSVVTGTNFPNKTLKAGNVMYDFTVPSSDGSNIMLSEILKTKELVVLNFWYVNCKFCVMEFPYMSSAYNRFKNRVEVIALNPFDNMDAVKTFLTENPLPFKVATCDVSVSNLFGIDAYPVSVVIDKYGVIREIEKEAILEANGFESLFQKYL